VEWCWAAFDGARGRLHAGAAGGVGRGEEEEGELLEGGGSSSHSASEVGVVGAMTAVALFAPRLVRDLVGVCPGDFLPASATFGVVAV
jgi:hypothetical protein